MISSQTETIDFLKKDNEILLEQIRFFKSLKFAPQSEKIKYEDTRQASLFNEADVGIGSRRGC